ncbi:MAG: hypothetical protein DWQ02_05615 [Bacteroidetes bacterium]|nr:MAG: hypothetical protein DWQ02_05615 [Bacteroidota bacterium]
MRLRFLIIAFMAMATFGFSQETQTIFSNDGTGTKSFGGYGGPFIHVTQINNDWGGIIGGKGGVVINGKFAFGGLGMGLINNMEFLGDDLNGNNNASLSLVYGAGGVFAEYIFNFESLIHFSIPVNLMAGSVAVQDATSEDLEIESSGIFIIEPGINLEFNLTKYFKPGIYLSYRQVFGSSLVNLSDQDISGVNIGLIVKFGSY